jgi:hypothetical protein
MPANILACLAISLPVLQGAYQYSLPVSQCSCQYPCLSRSVPVDILALLVLSLLISLPVSRCACQYPCLSRNVPANILACLPYPNYPACLVLSQLVSLLVQATISPDLKSSISDWRGGGEGGGGGMGG